MDLWVNLTLLLSQSTRADTEVVLLKLTLPSTRPSSAVTSSNLALALLAISVHLHTEIRNLELLSPPPCTSPRAQPLLTTPMSAVAIPTVTKVASEAEVDSEEAAEAEEVASTTTSIMVATSSNSRVPITRPSSARTLSRANANTVPSVLSLTEKENLKKVIQPQATLTLASTSLLLPSQAFHLLASTVCLPCLSLSSTSSKIQAFQEACHLKLTWECNSKSPCKIPCKDSQLEEHRAAPPSKSESSLPSVATVVLTLSEYVTC